MHAGSIPAEASTRTRPVLPDCNRAGGRQTGRDMTADFQGLRVTLVDGQGRTTAVTDAAILAALWTVPRED